jgi:hypothetical protein
MIYYFNHGLVQTFFYMILLTHFLFLILIQCFIKFFLLQLGLIFQIPFGYRYLIKVTIRQFNWKFFRNWLWLLKLDKMSALVFFCFLIFLVLFNSLYLDNSLCSSNLHLHRFFYLDQWHSILLLEHLQLV